MQGILVFIVVFGLLVFVHEFGHFVVAKKSGVLVREFSIGMGPKLFQVRRAKTTYTIRWLPLGGYVRLAGTDDESKIDPGTNVVLALNDHDEVVRIDASESDLPIEGIPVQVVKADLVDALEITGYENGEEEKEVTYKVNHDATIIDKSQTELVIAPRDTLFNHANVWQKLATNIAGPLMNILLGFVVFLIWTFTVPGPGTNTISHVEANSPAAKAKIVSGDTISKIDSKKMKDFADVSDAIQAANGKKIALTLVKNGKIRTVHVKPEIKKIGKQKAYLIGIEAKSNENFGVKFMRGLSMATSTTGLIFKAVANLFSHFSLNKLSGPVGIYSQTAQVSQMGLTYVLAFLGMISINLGIVNLIPIPGLDGGKVLLNLIELVLGHPISEEHEALVELIGFGLLLLLIIAVTGNDIYRYFIK